MVEVNWTLLVLEDVENIAEFIAHDSEQYAAIQVTRFFDLVKILEKHPLAGRVVPEFNIETVRELPMGNYRIVNRIVSEARVDIVTVHHSNRLLSNNPHFEK